MDPEKQLGKYFRDMGQADDLTPQDIKDLLDCRSTEEILKIFKGMPLYDQIDQDALNDLAAILFPKSQPQLPLPKKKLVADGVAVETVILPTDKAEYFRLAEDYKLVQTVETGFSYQHLVRMLLMAYKLSHPELGSLWLDETTKPTLEELREEALRLAKTLKDEEKDSDNIEQYIKSIVSSTSPAQILNDLQRIKEKLVFLDIYEFARLIKSSKDVQASIQGKQVIVFIGPTGSGKSTAILSLLGYKMAIKLWMGMRWLTTANPVSDIQAQKLITSPSTKSVTRDITCVEYSGDQFSFQGLSFVDTPGFYDTQGSEVDLSNAIGVAKAVRSFGKVRFVVVLGGLNQGNRGEGIKQIAQTLCSIFPKYHQVNKGVMFLFNRFLHPEGINALIKTIWKQMPDINKDNQNLKKVYDDLIKKTSYQGSISNAESVLAFEPLQDSIESVLQKINSLTPVTNLTANRFEVNYSRNSRSDIQKQTKFIEDQISAYFKMDKLNVVTYFFNLLNDIHCLLKDEDSSAEILEAKQRASDRIKESITRQCMDEIVSFNARVRNRSLAVEDIQKYLCQKQMCKKYAVLRQYISVPDFENRWESNLEEIMRSLVEELAMEPKDPESIINIIIMLAQHFGKQSCVQDLLREFQGKVKQKSKEYQNILKDGRYLESLKSYNQCNKYIGYLVQLGDLEAESHLNVLKMVAADYIKDTEKKIRPHIDNLNQISESDMDEIVMASETFLKISNSYEYLGKVPHSEEIRQVLESFGEVINSKVKEIAEQTSLWIENCKVLTNQIVEKIKTHNAKLSQLKRIPQLKSQINNIERFISQKLSLFIESAVNVVEIFGSNLKQKKLQFYKLTKEVKKLDESINSVEKLSKLLNGREKEECLLSQTKEIINEWLTDILNSVLHLKLNLNDSSIGDKLDKINEALKIIHAFGIENESTQRLSDVFKLSEFAEICREIRTTVSRLLTKTMQDIRSHLTALQQDVARNKIDTVPDKYKILNLKTIDLCLNILEMGATIFKDMSSEQKEFDNLKSSFQTELITYYDYVRDMIYQDLSNIKKITLTDTKNEDKTLVKNIKDRLEIVKLIETRYSYVRQILSNFDPVVILESVDKTLTTIYEDMQATLVDSSQKRKIPDNFASFRVRCHYLILLDPYLGSGTAYSFKKLQIQSKELMEKVELTLTSKFSNAFKMKEYETVKVILDELKLSNLTLHEDNVSHITIYLKHVLSNVKRLKEKEQTHEISQNLIDLVEELEAISSKLGNHIPKEILDKTKESMKEVSSLLIKEYQSRTAEIQELLKQSRVGEVYEKLGELEKLEKILSQGSQTNKKELRKAEELKNRMNVITSNFKTKVDNQKKLLQFDEGFKQLFNTIFEPLNTSNPQLRIIKNAYTKRIEGEIDEIIVEIDTDQKFTSESVLKYKNKLNNVPKYIKDEHIKRVYDVINRKNTLWEKERDKMEDTVNSIDVISNRRINPKVLMYLNESNSKPLITKSLISKIQNKLEEALINLPVNSISDLHLEAGKVIELESNEKRKVELISLYNQIERKAKEKACSVLKGLIFEITKSTIRSTEESPPSSLKQQQFLQDIFECLRLAPERRNLIGDITQIISTEMRTFIFALFTHIQALKKGNINKDFLEPKNSDEVIKSSLSKMLNLSNCCSFANKFLEFCETYKTLSVVQKWRTDIKPSRGEANISCDLETICQKYLPKVEFLLRFSVVDLLLKDATEVQKSIKQLYFIRRFVALTFPQMITCIGENKLTHFNLIEANLKLNVNDKVKEMKNKVIEWSKAPHLNSNRDVESLKGYLTVINVYESIFLNGVQERTISHFNKNILETLKEQILSTKKIIQTKQIKEIPQIVRKIESISKVYTHFVAPDHPQMEEYILKEVFEVAKEAFDSTLENALKTSLYELTSTEYKKFLKDYPNFQKESNKQQKKLKEKDVKRVFDAIPKKFREAASNLYQNFVNTFNKIVSSQEKSSISDTIDYLFKQIRQIIESEEDSPSNIVSHIFAMWHFCKCRMENNCKVFQNPPTPSQVVAVFLLIGATGTTVEASDTNNILIHLKFKDGRSLVLAIVACYLALKGQEVDCLFQTQYSRDNYVEEYQLLAKKLDVSQKVKNLTFKEIASNLFGLIKVYEMATEVLNFDIFKPEEHKQQSPCSSRVLLLEEVTTLCSEEYFGKFYEPCVELRYHIIQNILDYVYRQLKSGKTPGQQALNSCQLKDAINQKPNLRSILTKQFQLLIKASQLYTPRINESCECQNNKIKQRVTEGVHAFHDKVDYKLILETIKHYEYKNFGSVQKITGLSDDNCSPSLSLGRISYHQIPKQYGNVLGISSAPITGSLLAMLESMLEVTPTFDVPEFNQLQISPIVSVQKSEDRHQSIVNEIEKAKRPNRPIIVIFESVIALMEFSASMQFMAKKSQAKLVHEYRPKEVVNNRLENCIVEGGLILVTKGVILGRQVLSHDKLDKLKKEGGICLIQTFIPLYESEEAQLRELTLTSEFQNTFIQIILTKGLHDFLGISNDSNTEDFLSMNDKKLLERIRESRDKKIEGFFKDRMEDVNVLKPQHLKIKNFLENPKTALSVLDHIDKQIETQPISNQLKIVILIMASSDTNSYVKALSQAIYDIFKEGNEILKKYNQKLSIQLVGATPSDRLKNTCEQILKVSSVETYYYNIFYSLKGFENCLGKNDMQLDKGYERCLSLLPISHIALIHKEQAEEEQKTQHSESRHLNTKTNITTSRSCMISPTEAKKEMMKKNIKITNLVDTLKRQQKFWGKLFNQSDKTKLIHIFNGIIKELVQPDPSKINGKSKSK